MLKFHCFIERLVDKLTRDEFIAFSTFPILVILGLIMCIINFIGGLI